MTKVATPATNSGNSGTGSSNNGSSGNHSRGSNPVEVPSATGEPGAVPTVTPPGITSPVTQVPLTGADPKITGANDTPPSVPGGADTPGKGVTAVNTDAMRTFAANIQELVSPLTDSMNAVQGVHVRAGAFPSALTLASKINDPQSGLQQSLYQSVNQIIQAIGDTGDGVTQMAMHYESGEAANKITADNYNTYLGEAGAMINQLVPSGGTAASSVGAPSAGAAGSAGSTGGSSTGGSAGSSGSHAS